MLLIAKKSVAFTFLFLLIIENLTHGQEWSSVYFDSVYSFYRQRLREKFVVVDSLVEFPGVNLPAVEINHTSNITDWGDANAGISHYLSLLATEYALFRKTGESTKTTVKELFYAMLAIERLDLYSEAYLRKYSVDNQNNNVFLLKYPADINGFHIRDDVSHEFWNKYQSQFVTPYFKSVFEDANRQGISQDNLIHHLEGLALVNVLVGKVSVKDVPVVFFTDCIPRYLHQKQIWRGDSVDFSRWVADITERYLLLLQNSQPRRLPKPWFGLRTHWYLADPVTHRLVKEGAGDDLDLALFYQYGFIKAAESIIGKQLREYPGLLGMEGWFFRLLLTNRSIELPLIKKSIPIRFDDYKLRSLATTGNVAGYDTYHRLVYYRNHTPVLKYEHFPLIWIVLHDPCRTLLKSPEQYRFEREYYRQLFIDIPPEGPTSKNSIQWRSTSRCVWPENLIRPWESNSEFSGMDFMMLYNLYRLVFGE